MKKIFLLTLKSALRDTYLFFWSLVVPVAAIFGLSYFVKIDNYESLILTGMTAVSVLFYAFMTTTFAVLSQRRRGVYNLLHMTAMPIWKYIISVSAAWTLISAVSSFFVLGAGILFLDIQIDIVSIVLCLPVICVASLSYVFLSFFMSSFCRNEAHANMLCNFVTLPFMLCSTAFYSMESMPDAIRFLNRINPFEYFVTGLRTAFGLNIYEYFMQLGVIFVFLLLALLLAAKTFRYSDVK